MRAVDVPIYDFTSHQRSTEVRRVEPADVVIIEGILVLHIEEIRSLLNMKIFVDTDDDLRLARRCDAAHIVLWQAGVACKGSAWGVWASIGVTDKSCHLSGCSHESCTV